METLQAIQKRCSLKGHCSGKEIEAEKLNKVLEAARWAPSAHNYQPWHFIVVQGRQAVETLVDGAFSEKNWVARSAAAIIVVCAKPGEDVIEAGKEYYLFDLGLAVENLLLAATDQGLVTHLILRFDEAKVRQILQIPEEFRVVIVTPLAYPAEGSYDSAAQERLGERTRKLPGEVVHYNKWLQGEDS
jgi:nitroreductase